LYPPPVLAVRGHQTEFLILPKEKTESFLEGFTKSGGYGVYIKGHQEPMIL